MFHQTIIVGNLGRDPDLRYLPSGDPVCNFSVAVNEQWTDRESGEPRKRTAWFRVATFRKTAENCNQYLQKGQQVTVIGRLSFDETTGGPKVFTKQDGSSGASFELNAQRVIFGGRSTSPEGEPRGVTEENVPQGAGDASEIPF